MESDKIYNQTRKCVGHSETTDTLRLHVVHSLHKERNLQKQVKFSLSLNIMVADIAKGPLERTHLLLFQPAEVECVRAESHCLFVNSHLGPRVQSQREFIVLFTDLVCWNVQAHCVLRHLSTAIAHHWNQLEKSGKGNCISPIGRYKLHPNYSA